MRALDLKALEEFLVLAVADEMSAAKVGVHSSGAKANPAAMWDCPRDSPV